MPKRRGRERPKSFAQMDRRRKTFDSDVNVFMGQLIEDGKKITTRSVCEQIGLDYDLVTERTKVTNAIARQRRDLQDAWKVFEVGSTYSERYAEFSKDFIAFDLWKKNNKGLYDRLVNDYGLTEEQVHDVWVSERMFDAFVDNGKEHNFYFFVTEWDPGERAWVYTTPDYWKYTQYNLKIAKKYSKAIKTLLIRHQTMHMMLTSGEKVDTAYQLQEDVEKMLTDGKPQRFRCEACMEHGILKEFPTQQQLVAHYNGLHSVVSGAAVSSPVAGDDKDDYSWAKYTPETNDQSSRRDDGGGDSQS